MTKRYRRSASTATRYKMSLAKQGKKNPMFGKHHDKKTRKLISDKLKRYWQSILIYE